MTIAPVVTTHRGPVRFGPRQYHRFRRFGDQREHLIEWLHAALPGDRQIRSVRPQAGSDLFGSVRIAGQRCRHRLTGGNRAAHLGREGHARRE